ncbi:serine/threonine-protein kinase [Ahniella affigens]|uniref:serine/threonine-protein kinase n=1 Tax=Ahniella affigens TaxID=2021234 RepID=UPI001474C95B|nr:serine/threonine-protein kinase [Ahniella affigens]
MSRPDYWQLKQAFEALLDRSADAQDAYLQTLAESDPDLARIMSKRLARMRANIAAEATPITVDQVTPDIPGFCVIAAAGAGGMGQVWKVHRDAQPDQILALKQIHRSHLDAPLDAQMRRRFDQERAVLARLSHPNIVPLIDAGVDSEDRPYLLTPWIDGLRIDHWCAAQQASLVDRVRLIRDLAEAIGHAHAQLIIHRDLKPANVLVDGNREVRVLDFGIAKLLDQSDTYRSDTTTGFSLMTLRYAAPEQVQQGVLGPGCDLYAIGVMLYELIAARSPYDGAENPAALSLAIANVQPEPPSRRCQLAHGALHVADLDAITLKLLRKPPADRYGSAQELVADLNRWLAGDVVLARGDERGYLAKRWLWRWRFGLAAAMLIPVLITWHVWRLDAQLAETARQRDRARAVADYFVDLFRNADPGASREGSITARELLEASAGRLETDPSLNADTRGLLQMVTGRVYTDLGMVAEAEPLLAAAIERMQRESPKPVAELLDALRTHAAVLYQLDRVPESLARSEAAIALLESEHETHSERYAGMLQNAALALATMGKQDDADQLFERALSVLATSHPTSRAYALLLLNLGGDRASRFEHQAAVTYFDRAEPVANALQPPDADLSWSIRRASLSSKLELARTREAFAALRTEIATASDAATAFYGRDHLETAFWQELAGISAALVGNWQQTQTAFNASRDIARHLFEAPDHPFRQRFELNAQIARFVADPNDTVARAALSAARDSVQTASPEAPEVALLGELLSVPACANFGASIPSDLYSETPPADATLPAWLQHLQLVAGHWRSKRC